MPLKVLAGPEIGLPTLSDDCPLSRRSVVREVCLQGLTPRWLVFACCEEVEYLVNVMHSTAKDKPQFGRNGSCNVEQRGTLEVTFAEFGEAGANETSFKSACHRVTPVHTTHQTILVSTTYERILHPKSQCLLCLT
jgi:hypothetical protein